MDRFKGGHELRIRTILCSCHGVEVVVVDEGENVVRPLDGGLVRCPLFRGGSIMDDRRNTYRFFGVSLGQYLFQEACRRK